MVAVVVLVSDFKTRLEKVQISKMKKKKGKNFGIVKKKKNLGERDTDIYMCVCVCGAHAYTTSVIQMLNWECLQH